MGFENRVFVRGSLFGRGVFRGGLYTCLYKVLFWLYNGVFVLVFCVCVVYVFVYSLSRTWLAPVQHCMYDTCYMSVFSHKIMQQCEKLHNKTLQNATGVHVN